MMENLDLPRTMQAAHFRGNGQIDLVPKPVPIPEPAHLLLCVKANALCGSERGQYADGAAFKQGHEPPIHARAGRWALLLAFAAIESFETGRRVAI